MSGTTSEAIKSITLKKIDWGNATRHLYNTLIRILAKLSAQFMFNAKGKIVLDLTLIDDPLVRNSSTRFC